MLEPVIRVLEASGLRVDVADSPAALGGHHLVLVHDAIGTGAVELCLALRARSAVPIIVLRVSDDEDAVVTALDAGADDVITLPGEPRALAARVRAAMRRGPQPTPEGESADAAVEVGDVRLEPTIGYVATVAGQHVELTGKEFKLLQVLMTNAGHVVPRTVLIDRVWGADAPEGKTLDTHVRRLRAKIEANPARPSRIVTVRTVGYRYNRPRR